METLDRAAVAAAGLTDWRPLAQGLHARYAVASLADAARLTAAVAGAAGPHGDHLVATTTADAVVLWLRTPHDRGVWVTAADVEVARAVEEVARGLGAHPEPDRVVQLELALDTWQVPAQSRFWAALLTGDPDHHHAGGDVVDLAPGLPHVWFQETEAHDEPRQRWHLDLWLEPSVAPARIEAAVAAGGRVADDGEWPSFLVLADPEGNKVCVCTVLDRDAPPPAG